MGELLQEILQAVFLPLLKIILQEEGNLEMFHLLKNKSVAVSLRLDKQMKNRLDEIARNEGISLSGMLRKIIDQFLNFYGKRKRPVL